MPHRSYWELRHDSITIQLRFNFVLLFSKLLQSDHYRILYIPRQLCCRGIFKIGSGMISCNAITVELNLHLIWMRYLSRQWFFDSKFGIICTALLQTKPHRNICNNILSNPKCFHPSKWSRQCHWQCRIEIKLFNWKKLHVVKRFNCITFPIHTGQYTWNALRCGRSQI